MQSEKVASIYQVRRADLKGEELAMHVETLGFVSPTMLSRAPAILSLSLVYKMSHTGDPWLE